jgi:hypothetical protein
MSDRRRRPSVESLEGRTLPAGSSSPTNPAAEIDAHGDAAPTRCRLRWDAGAPLLDRS